MVQGPINQVRCVICLPASMHLIEAGQCSHGETPTRKRVAEDAQKSLALRSLPNLAKQALGGCALRVGRFLAEALVMLSGSNFVMHCSLCYLLCPVGGCFLHLLFFLAIPEVGLGEYNLFEALTQRGSATGLRCHRY